MTSADILAEFLILFPTFQETICEYRPTSIRGIDVTLRDGTEMHFTYFDKFNWSLSSRKDSD